MAIRGVQIAALALAAILVAVAPLAEGQNLVFNADFDSDVAGWNPFPLASIVWDPLDSTGNPASGSALVSNNSTTAGDGTGAWQCIDGLVGGLTYRIAADIMVPSGQSNTGSAYLLVQWYSQPGCYGSLGLLSGPEVTTSMPDVWYSTVDSGEAPPGTQSARLRLNILKGEDWGSLDASFDAAWFEEILFYDGFESGTTGAWSSVSGGFSPTLESW